MSGSVLAVQVALSLDTERVKWEVCHAGTASSSGECFPEEMTFIWVCKGGSGDQRLGGWSGYKAHLRCGKRRSALLSNSLHKRCFCSL